MTAYYDEYFEIKVRKGDPQSYIQIHFLADIPLGLDILFALSCKI